MWPVYMSPSRVRGGGTPLADDFAPRLIAVCAASALVLYVARFLVHRWVVDARRKDILERRREAAEAWGAEALKVRAVGHDGDRIELARRSEREGGRFESNAIAVALEDGSERQLAEGARVHGVLDGFARGKGPEGAQTLEIGAGETFFVVATRRGDDEGDGSDGSQEGSPFRDAARRRELLAVDGAYRCDRNAPPPLFETDDLPSRPRFNPLLYPGIAIALMGGMYVTLSKPALDASSPAIVVVMMFAEIFAWSFVVAAPWKRKAPPRR